MLGVHVTANKLAEKLYRTKWQLRCMIEVNIPLLPLKHHLSQDIVGKSNHKTSWLSQISQQTYFQPEWRLSEAPNTWWRSSENDITRLQCHKPARQIVLGAGKTSTSNHANRKRQAFCRSQQRGQQPFHQQANTALRAVGSCPGTRLEFSKCCAIGRQQAFISKQQGLTWR